jgi:protein-tyrosine phosphatase
MEVSTATSVDVRELLGLRDNLASWLLGRGIDQWQPGEVPRNLIEDEVAQGFVHIVRCQDELVAAVTVTWADPVVWSERSDSAGYIHRLMVDRRWAGREIGLSLLTWSETHIRHSGRTLARLDCVRSNRRLRDYYEARGYHLVGYQDFPDIPWANETALYEKLLLISRLSPQPE